MGAVVDCVREPRALYCPTDLWLDALERRRALLAALLLSGLVLREQRRIFYFLAQRFSVFLELYEMECCFDKFVVMLYDNQNI